MPQLLLVNGYVFGLMQLVLPSVHVYFEMVLSSCSQGATRVAICTRVQRQLVLLKFFICGTRVLFVAAVSPTAPSLAGQIQTDIENDTFRSFVRSTRVVIHT